MTVNCGANDGDQDTISVYMGAAGKGNKAALVKIGQFGPEDVIQTRGRSNAANSFYEANVTNGQDADMLAFLNKFAGAGTFTSSNTTFKNVGEIVVASSTASGWDAQFVVSGLTQPVSPLQFHIVPYRIYILAIIEFIFILASSEIR